MKDIDFRVRTILLSFMGGSMGFGSRSDIYMLLKGNSREKGSVLLF
jgi:hypothetical protein